MSELTKKAQEVIGSVAEIINAHAFAKSEKIINEDNGLILNPNAKFDLWAMKNSGKDKDVLDAFFKMQHIQIAKGVEAERWTDPYMNPVPGSDIELLRSLNFSMNPTGSDTDHIPVISPNSVSIVRMGSAINVSEEAAQLAVVDMTTKDSVYARLAFTRVQMQSLSFNILQRCGEATRKSLIENIQRDVMRRMALELATANRIEFASGDAWTLPMFQTAIQLIKTAGGDMGNLYLAIDAEYLMKLWALEDTNGNNLFLNNLYVPKLDNNGDTPQRVGPAKIVSVTNAPGVEDDWSAIETTETHKCMFMYDASAIPVSIETAPAVLEATTLASGTYGYAFHQLYGSKVLNDDLVVGFKEYEA